VLVIAGECYAIFDLEELLILLGCELSSVGGSILKE
jgi:hypothetical protein